ncbi:uncharacterized protein LOC117786671 [Drosophila innubila]|uniref:uncharacterized protein LOC117786671 n=1 Tax=Drosophila innubila TaxID=198719 RepID=UPI00148CD3DA|nr:uncharacterized protein LOC117786671 [Drosophila innubila]
MAKRVKVIGCCPYCKREVGVDMRPINEVDPRRMEEILHGLTSSSSSSHQSVQSTTGADELQDANADSQISLEQSSSHNPVVNFTDKMLGYVQQEFERPNSSQSTLTDDQIGIIMSMLKEEQVALNQYTNDRNKRPMSRRQR